MKNKEIRELMCKHAAMLEEGWEPDVNSANIIQYSRENKEGTRAHISLPSIINASFKDLHKFGVFSCIYKMRKPYECLPWVMGVVEEPADIKDLYEKIQSNF